MIWQGTKIMGVVALATLSWAAVAAPALAQNKALARCIDTGAKGEIRIVKSYGSAASRCLKLAASGRLPVRMSADQCVVADLKGKILKAKSKLVHDSDQRCTAQQNIGFSSAGVINGTTREEVVNLLEDVFGASFDVAVVLSDTNRDAAACQKSVLRAIGKLTDTKLKAFRVCEKKGFKSGDITTVEEFAACINRLNSDPKNRVQKARGNLSLAIARSCTTAGVNVQTTFPGSCAFESDLSGCFDARANCRVCRLLDEGHLLNVDCDVVDDGMSNASCISSGTVPTTTTTTTSTTTTTVPVGCGDGFCTLDENCISCQQDCGLCFPIRSVAIIGDSISKGFNAQSEAICPMSDQEEYNWATSDTNGGNYCSAGSEGVRSFTERLECDLGNDVRSPDPNQAETGAQMLKDFHNQAVDVASWISGQPTRRMVGVFLGHNDVCGGDISRTNSSCDRGSDQDPLNHCRTTPEAFERELRKGLDVLIGVSDLHVRLASPARLTQLCRHKSKQNCFTFTSCNSIWQIVDFVADVFGSSGVCGSLTTDCNNDGRILRAFNTVSAYREIIRRVTAEYGAVVPGNPSPIVNIGGETVGGATKAFGVIVDNSDASWWYQMRSNQLSCCDCFHPSAVGQDAFGRVAHEGLTCSNDDPCCGTTGTVMQEALCEIPDTGGRVFPGIQP